MSAVDAARRGRFSADVRDHLAKGGHVYPATSETGGDSAESLRPGTVCAGHSLDTTMTPLNSCHDTMMVS
ncbi:hypothetical protein ACOBQX_22175 [Actinokineospora sp. G85]|uniref:hypothetical protein n=1 Tax=Actinokineospora sp. G85 TaxID=3406626 RepID=UPI003C720A8D